MDTIETTNAALASSTNAQEVPVTKTQTRKSNRPKDVIAAEKELIAQKRAQEEAKRIALGHKKPGPRARAATAPKLPKRDAASLMLSPEQVESAAVAKRDDRQERIDDFLAGFDSLDEAVTVMNEMYAKCFASDVAA